MNFIKIGRPMAGGSQIIINKNGITFITPAKFEAKAGQHLFKSGEKDEAKAGQHLFKSGEKVALPAMALPQPICIECLMKVAKEGLGIVRR